MFKRSPMFATAVLAVVVSACSGAASPSVAPPSVAPPSVAPPATSAAPASAAASPSAAASTAGSGSTVVAKDLGSAGTGLVAGSNGMSLYTFTKDTPNSGTSACNAGCIDTWPALSVASGGAPSAGDGVSGTLGTITRGDGTLQVTYNGLPLYFFKNDAQPGDTNGVYTNWELAKP
jgi:predicted lipoprotein with Yx(FWY)xxD motif